MQVAFKTFFPSKYFKGHVKIISDIDVRFTVFYDGRQLKYISSVHLELLINEKNKIEIFFFFY